jgi:hypothetical protein
MSNRRKYRKIVRGSRSGTLAVLFGFWLIGACGPDDAVSRIPVQALTVEACTEGEGRAAKLYLRNLDDFPWRGTSVSVTKGGREYEVGIDPRSKSKHSDRLDYWPSEESTPSAPFDAAGDFVFKGRSSDPKDPMYGQEQVPLTNFGHLEGARIVVATPFPAEWEGEVVPCEQGRLSLRTPGGRPDGRPPLPM